MSSIHIDLEGQALDSTSTLGPYAETENGKDDQPSETSLLLNRTETNDTQGSCVDIHYIGVDRRQFRMIIACMVFGNGIGFFDSTLMASSHPAITSYFNASNAASWLSTVFYLTSTVFQPLYGRISDTTGRRPVMGFAIVLFLLTTVWCALAQSMGSFIAARACCGAGAGGVISMSMIIMSDVVKIEYRGIYQSYLNMSLGVGSGLGAALGGFLCDRLGWRWVFGIQVPLIVAYLLLAFFFVPQNLGPNLAESQGKTLRDSFQNFDSRGAVVLTVTVTSLILGINLGGNIYTWTHPLVITALVLSLCSAVFLVHTERHAQRPMLPIPLLTTRPVSSLMWSNLLSSIVTNTVLFSKHPEPVPATISSATATSCLI